MDQPSDQRVSSPLAATQGGGAEAHPPIGTEAELGAEKVDDLSDGESRDKASEATPSEALTDVAAGEPADADVDPIAQPVDADFVTLAEPASETPVAQHQMRSAPPDLATSALPYAAPDLEMMSAAWSPLRRYFPLMRTGLVLVVASALIGLAIGVLYSVFQYRIYSTFLPWIRLGQGALAWIGMILIGWTAFKISRTITDRVVSGWMTVIWIGVMIERSFNLGWSGMPYALQRYVPVYWMTSIVIVILAVVTAYLDRRILRSRFINRRRLAIGLAIASVAGWTIYAILNNVFWYSTWPTPPRSNVLMLRALQASNIGSLACGIAAEIFLILQLADIEYHLWLARSGLLPKPKADIVFAQRVNPETPSHGATS